MADESLPLALACTFRFAQRTTEGHLVALDEEETDGADWEDSEIVTIRMTAPGAPVLVALVACGSAPEPFRADYDAGIVSTPSGDFDIQEFQMSHFRCDAAGVYVGNFLDPAWVQMRDARAAGNEPHVADVASLVAARRRAEGTADQIDWRMFDIAAAGETDGLTAEEALARSRFRNGAPLHRVHGLEGLVSMRTEAEDTEDDNVLIGAVPELVLVGWQEIRAFPQYLIDGVRVLFRQFLADRIGDTPIEEIVRLQLPRGEMQAICEVFEQEGFDDMGTSRPFVDDRVMRGGYTTSEVRNFRGNGVDIIVFEDFAGSYAYAWPEQIHLKAERNAGPSR